MEPSDFQHRLVRDLAWVMAAPGLLDRQGYWQGRCVGDDWCQRRYAEQLDWLCALDADPSPIDRQLRGNARAEAHHFRLGHYVEQLLAIWLRRLAGREAVRCGLSVRDGRRTIGEIDLLWRDPDRPLVHHWEVTWKLYLRAPPDPAGRPDGLDAWYGLHPRDRFRDKLRKLFRDQLRVTERPAGRSVVTGTFGELPCESRALIKGQLFYLPEQPDETVAPSLSSDHSRGCWLHHRDTPERLPQERRSHRWTMLPRQEWLAPAVRQRGSERVLARGELWQAIRGHPLRPHVVAELAPALDGRWVECARHVIAPDDWQAGVWRELVD